ncbi:MAG: PilZ domain-containing protein [Candidatus Goldbacteria bacterium]|nr:PilZ domain-containing protein [Candidatus Goldiibacteriota bacterium]
MIEGKLYIEKRKFKRVIKSFPIKYKLMPKDNIIESKKNEGKTKDISLGGVRIEGEIIGNVDDIIRIEFTLKDNDNPIITFAEIKWIKEINGIPQFGVEFLTLKNEDKQIIEQLINE